MFNNKLFYVIKNMNVVNCEGESFEGPPLQPYFSIVKCIPTYNSAKFLPLIISVRVCCSLIFTARLQSNVLKEIGKRRKIVKFCLEVFSLITAQAWKLKMYEERNHL